MLQKNGHVRERASLMILKNISRLPSENPVAPAKSFVIASRMMPPTLDRGYQSTATRNDSVKSVFASESCQNDRTRQIVIASNNQIHTEDLFDRVPTSYEKDVIQIWLRECNLVNRKKMSK
jgi:hypothetical protein